MAQFQISGKVVADDGKSVEFAEIVLVKNNAAILSQLTDTVGNFSVASPRGEIELLIRQIGDTLYRKKTNVEKNTDLGIITVQPKPDILQTATVVAKRKLIERKADRMVFNVVNMPSTDGGDALEILKVTPSLMVDNSSINIAGKSSVNVMINDRPVKMSGDALMNFLKTLRANDIQSIEVITTPPAKYEAEGNSGLVNIVLKKTLLDTWSASVYGIYQQAEYARGTVGGGFNYRKNALSFYANAAYGSGKSNEDSQTVIFYPDLKWDVNRYGVSSSNALNARTGFDLNIKNSLTVGAQYMGSFAKAKNTGNNPTNLLDIATGNNTGFIKTETSSSPKSNFHSGNMYSVIRLDTLGRKINIDFDALAYNSKNDAIYRSTTANSIYPAIPNGFESGNNMIDRKITNYAAQIDVEHPAGKIELNYGVKFSFSNTDNDIHVFNLSSGIPVNDPDKTNEFIYRENTQAAYISGSTQFGKWQAQLGLRAENTQFKGNSVTMDTVFKKSYFELFPTAYIVYSPNDNNTFYVEYSRRLSRPNFGHLNPFRSYSNSYSYYQGNPELAPMFTNNITAGYFYDSQFEFALDYSHYKDNLGGGVTIVDPDGYTQISTHMNYLDGYSIGLRTFYIFNSLSWWTSQISINVNYDHSDSKIYPLTPKTGNGYGASFQTYNIFYLNSSKNISAGFDFTYVPAHNSQTLTHMYASTNMNAFFKMLFLNKTLSVTLSGNNLLKEYSFNYRSESNGATTYSKAHYNPRFVRLTVSYSFGSKKVNVRQHNITNQEEKNRIY